MMIWKWETRTILEAGRTQALHYLATATKDQTGSGLDMHVDCHREVGSSHDRALESIQYHALCACCV